MAYVLITHAVEDYTAWKIGFDGASDLRKSAGEIEYQVLKYEDKPNTIVHFSKWQSHSQARAFFESDKVKKIRKEFGVEDPKFVYLDALENGTL